VIEHSRPESRHPGNRLFGEWTIREVFQGGMGVVYLVHQDDLGMNLAAKTFRDEVFDSNPDLARRFEREMLSWINLDAHPRVVQAHFVQVIQGKPYLFLEYVPGGDLGRLIGTAKLDVPLALLLAVQFCEGMTHILSKGIKVHRDIKPQNCLLHEVGESLLLKITDFGLAGLFDDSTVANVLAASHTPTPAWRRWLGRLWSGSTPGRQRPLIDI
jgi:serine/threonine protein kinase